MYGIKSRGQTKLLVALMAGLFAWLSAGNVVAQDETGELMDLSLEELLGLEVTTFSRTPQLLSATPAAMFVITQKDIVRSGARTIPDVLRMVPGVEVAQVDASTWAVTARGSNGVFANKLLVLQDGRSIYSPLYSGVYWDINDTDLQSIDRIEVIRGPGATMWGSNAVNGVINIITSKATGDDRGKADVVIGTERTEGKFSASGDVGAASIRAYGKYFDREGFDNSGFDGWDMLRGGVRVDWDYSETSSLTFTSEVFEGDIGERTVRPSLPAPYSSTADETRGVSGGFALLSWDKQLSDTSGFRFQTYYDQTNTGDVAPAETRDTIDVDWQHHFRWGGRNDIVWGLGYRYSEDETTGDFTITLTPDARRLEIFSAFVQDNLKLSDELFLLVGTKVSRNNFSVNNLEWEPNVRLSWQASEQHTLWSSVARAVRIPSRVEQDGTIHGGVVPPGVPINGAVYSEPFLATVQGNPDQETEEVTAYEAGYRGYFGSSVELDVSVFYNEYENVRSIEVLGPPVCQPESGIPPAGGPDSCPYFPPFNDSYIELTLDMRNLTDFDSYGAEFNMSWQAVGSLYLQGNYSYLHVDDLPVTPFSAGSDSPAHQVSLRSLWDMSAAIDLDFWLRYVGELEQQDVPAYITLDARASWEMTERLQMALVGRNLLEEGHVEFVEEFGETTGVEIPREVYLELTVDF
jgi:iron complex outermembrane receptor protein